MNAKLLFRFILMGLMLSALVLAGCDDGDDGDNGVAGASAYEIAVDNGFEGTEQEWLDSLQGDSATQADETCNVCHGAGKAIGIDAQHPLVPEKPIVTVTDITRTGDILTVYINAVDSEGDPVEGVGLVSPSSGSDLRVYMADIVPANTVTTNTPTNTFVTAYLERWADDRGNTTGVVISEPTPGNYVFQMVTPVTEIGGADAPEGDPTHTQRVYVRVDPRDFGVYTRSMAVVDFTLPADGGSTGDLTGVGTTRTIVAQSACTSCHGDPLERAAHGGGYQSPQVCNMCHSPIGGDNGDWMQASGFWTASLIHGIHSATLVGTWPEPGEESTADFTEVTYPQNIAECSVCHFDDPDEDQDLVDNWKTNPAIETCTGCHDVTFGAGATHSGGTQPNSTCVICHPAEGNGVGQSVAGAHEVDYDADNLLYNTTISISPDANADGVYEVGETILVTATTDQGFDYTETDTAFLRSANLYVYGPRALAVPVLTPGSTTDPDYVDPEITPPGTPPDQGRSMLASAQADDPNVLTDASGFKYQLLEVTEDMAAGTYMIQTNIDYSATGDRTTDGRHIGPRFYPLDGWQLLTFQVGTADEEEKVAGECTGCHEQRNFSTYAHRSYFGTDGCLACHDQSGNHADPLTNRVHAVHAASTEGDLTNVPGEDPSRVWDEITFPRGLNSSCAACHNSGDDGYRVAPNGSWGFACIGCHAETEGARAHMEQNGAPFPEH